MSDAEREFSRSIKALKTLRVINGCISIDPREVLDQPGYEEDRARAGAWVRERQQKINAASLGWKTVDQITIESLSKALAHSLMQSRRDGLTVDQAINQLRCVFASGERDQ
ncbi:hypothetical protein [Pseudomonas sp. NA-150]|uniref:hypothetical protein n=1 Tax=Pseudomonas sp. NA-150 TaxID=3367525 RepID=UPI0037CC9D40